MSISLEKIELTNFRSFVGHHVIEFDKSGLVLIRGKNEDSSGESGAGKSSIILGIAYLLGSANYSAKEMKNWSNEDPMIVKGHFSTPNGPMSISRGSKLTLEYQGLTVIGKDVELELDRIFGANAQMRSTLVYREQKANGYFLNLTDSEKKSFLTDLLGLDRFEKAIEICDSNLKGLYLEAAQHKGALEGAQRAVVDCESRKNPYDVDSWMRLIAKMETSLSQLKQKENMYKATVSGMQKSISNKLSVIESDFESFKAATEAELKAILSAPVDNSIVLELSSKMEKVESKIAELEIADRKNEAEVNVKRWNLQSGIEDTKRDVKRSEADLHSKKQKIEALDKGRCYVCDSEYANSAKERISLQSEVDIIAKGIVLAHETIESYGEQLKSLSFSRNSMIGKLKEAYLKIKNEHMVESLSANSRLHDIKKPFQERIEAKRKETNSQAAEMVSKHNIELYEINENLEEIQAFILEESNLLAYNKAAEVSCKTNALQWETEYSQAAAELGLILSKVENVRDRINLEEDCRDLLKGFLDRIFSEVLDQIVSEANQIMGSLPNISHLSLEFKTERSTQKGAVKQSITPVVMFNGMERPLKSGPSGGMRTAVELAVDWALHKVISERTGSKLNFLLLDEPFDGLDTITKEAALEILQRISNDKLILVIDHSSEVKEHFSKVINVLYESGQSSIVTSV